MNDYRVWTKAEDAPDDLHRVEVEGYGTWTRVDGTQLFRHAGGVYLLRRFWRLRELGTVREVKQ